jgi:hypothetical protein
LHEGTLAKEPREGTKPRAATSKYALTCASPIRRLVRHSAAASLLLSVALVVLAHRPAVAAPRPAAPAPPVPRVTALRTTTPIVVDGRLDEDPWQRAQPAADFRQRNPDEGKPATERTEVRILYDDDALYIGARMFDSEPAKIARRLTRRDGDTNGIVDWLTVGIDPLHDHLTGVLFRVTAAGSVGDGILYNDSNSDETWDGVWNAAVTIDDQGWCAELRIPFSQLRFAAADHQVWGLHAVRMVQRKNEESWWAFIPKSDDAVVSKAGEIDGLDGIKSRRHLELLPYVTARGESLGTAEAGDPFNDGRRGSAAAGLDLKWGVTSNLTLDATVNPDFGQVEVDPAVVNLTAFETFYDEKRPFFIEGSQTFSRFGRNGVSGYMGFNRTNPTLFYSRRIGRAPQGSASGDFVDRPSATTILGAAKLAGKTGHGWTMNVIDAVTGREFADTATGGVSGRAEVEPLTNYFAGRVRRDVGQRAGFGMLATAVNRDVPDPSLASQLAGSAFVVGADGHYFFTGKRDYVVTGSLSASRVAGSIAALSRVQRSSARYYQRPDATHIAFDPTATSLTGWNLQTDFNKNSGSVRPNASFWAVSPGFEVNDLGFATSADRKGGHLAVVLLNQKPDRFSRSRSAVLAKWNTWNFAGDPLGDGYFANASATFHNYWSVQLMAHGGRWTSSDRLTRGGPIMRSPGFSTFSGEISGDDRKPVEWSVEGDYESRRDGSWQGRGEVGLTFKPLPALSLTVGPAFTRQLTTAQYVQTVTDPAATAMYGKRYVFAAIDQTELGLETRINVMLNPRMSLQAYIQPLISVGRYSGFKEAARPRTYDFVRYGVDGGSIAYDAADGVYRVVPQGGSGFSIPNPDFDFTSLRINAVYRWEFKPGSTLYAVWTQQREDQAADGRFDFSGDMSRMVHATGDNVFLVKFSYWISR